MRFPPFLALAFAAACTPTPAPAPEAGHLFLWTADADGADPDFLAVVDARRDSDTYGRVVATAPIGDRGTLPHHTENEFPENDSLFANGFPAGKTFVFDLTDPRRPSVAASFVTALGFGWPHSFARLPNGHVLATFQSPDSAYVPGGGLVELNEAGAAVRAGAAAVPEIPDSLNWPYGVTVFPDIDRVVTTVTDMGIGTDWRYRDPWFLQVWSLSELRPLATITLEPDSAGNGHRAPAEVRRLQDGSIYANTFSCGLYRLLDVEGASPRAERVHTFPGAGVFETPCAVPVVIGRFWIQTVSAINGLIVLDTTDPAAPVEVARLSLDERFHMPHWLAADRVSGDRVVVTGGMEGTWVLVVDVDPQTGALSIDETFREPGSDHPGISFEREEWPHGRTGRAWMHGAVFGK